MTETSKNKTDVATETRETETMTETGTKETQNRKKIHFYNEKKWIMAYWFKRCRKAPFTEKYLWELWEKWWGNDFTSKSDERFRELLPWIKEIKNTMTKDEIFLAQKEAEREAQRKAEEEKRLNAERKQNTLNNIQMMIDIGDETTETIARTGRMLKADEEKRKEHEEKMAWYRKQEKMRK